MTLVSALGLEDARVVALCGAGGKTSLMFALTRELVDLGERVLVTTTTKMAKDETDGAWPAFAAADARAVSARARSLFSTRGEGGAAVISFRDTDEAQGKRVGFAPGTIDELSRDGPFSRILVEADGAAKRPLKAPADHEPMIPACSDTVIIVAGLNGLGLPLAEDNLFRATLWAELTGGAPGRPITPDALARAVLHERGLARGAPPHAERVLFLNQADDRRRVSAGRQVCALLAAAADRRGLRKAVIGRLRPVPTIVAEFRF